MRKPGWQANRKKTLPANKLTLAERINKVEEMLLHNYRNAQIYEYAKTNWDIESRQVDIYISEVRERWKVNQSADIETKRQARIEQLQSLYQQAVADRDKAEARKILELISKFEGTATPIKIEQTVDWRVSWGDEAEPEKNEDTNEPDSRNA